MHIREGQTASTILSADTYLSINASKGDMKSSSSEVVYLSKRAKNNLDTSLLVDGKKVDIPSCVVKPGQKIEVKEKSKVNAQIVRSLELTNQTGMVEWVDVDKDKVFGIFTRIPTRE